MRLLISVLLLLGGLTGCHPEKDTPVEIEELRFEMTDQSELFFKNVRKSSYKLTEMRDAGMDMYSHASFLDTETPLKPTIIINWRSDRAYFYLENTLNSDSVRILIGNEEAIFTGSNQKDGLELAARIYNELLKGSEIYYRREGERLDLFTSDVQKNTFRVMFFDYLRLVEIR